MLDADIEKKHNEMVKDFKSFAPSLTDADVIALVSCALCEAFDLHLGELAYIICSLNEMD